MSERELLDMAGRVALRGMGRVEPNPLVGCVITDAAGEVVAIGHHAVWGGWHAERAAIERARTLGRLHRVRGGTAWVTLEPCAHVGKQPPCVGALIEAGVARVVFARRDPNPLAAGGAEMLRAAGVEAEESRASELATGVSDAFVHRVRTGRPWVVVKWAQFEDGRMATEAGQDRWISGAAARRRVHRLRGMVDAVVTGAGTVLADDPLLTVRGVRARRAAARVVLDGECRTPVNSKLVSSAGSGAVVVVTGRAGGACAAVLRERGVRVVGAELDGTGRVEWAGLIARMAFDGWDGAGARACATVLVEAGPRMIESVFAVGMANEAVVHVAGARERAGQADEGRAWCVAAAGRRVTELADSSRWRVAWVRRAGLDAEVVLRRRMEA